MSHGAEMDAPTVSSTIGLRPRPERSEKSTLLEHLTWFLLLIVFS